MTICCEPVISGRYSLAGGSQAERPIVKGKTAQGDIGGTLSHLKALHTPLIPTSSGRILKQIVART